MTTYSALFLAAEECVGIHARYASKGMSLSNVVLFGAKDFVEWRHYPNHDAVDHGSGYAFYYHAHSRNEMRQGEHGHFHLFKRDQKTDKHFFHLIGIALDQKGLPVRIFTTNQWVTGETLVDAGKVINALQNFDMVAKGQLAPVVRWLCAFNKLFHVEMKAIIEARDQKIADLESRFENKKFFFENRKYDVLTEREINLMNRVSKYLTDVN